MAHSRLQKTRAHRRTRRAFHWAKWPRERLLDLRLCDLGLAIEGTMLEQRITRLHAELAQRDLTFRPHLWLSDDWFTPDRMTGSAIPFYLAHPRLIRLERSLIGEAEGSTQSWCMKLLRHETGHAIDHAFRLTRRRRRQQLFGRSSLSYPRYYRPNPYSRRHVQHLEYWYAQSHPDEDFAETFAVWLQPRSQWRRRYQAWPQALHKLEYVDELMQELAGRRPLVRTRTRVEPIATLRKTLREHYHRKRGAYSLEHPNTYDRDLDRLFSRSRGRGGREPAPAFIRRYRREILDTASLWAGDHGYLLDHVLKDMIGRCRELRLFVNGSERRTKVDFTIVLVKHTVESLYRNRRWVEM
ncbi:MAG: putative zinc-binding metallopeptidase [Candidatus Eisenbacteria sp.]|nr:putative zinc-binding metallopeptidase [Candidatus Eisenbacteria bacterium]